MYRSAPFLKSQIAAIMNFYDPVVIDREYGGYINQLKDDGAIDDRLTKHLVGTCRFIYNYAVAARRLDPAFVRGAEHGLAFLQDFHRQADGGYAWVLSGREVADGTRHCYGHAFVLLAAAAAAQSGIDGSRSLIETTYALLEDRFRESGGPLYVDVIDAQSWNSVDPYRGQNANMHLCEAMLAAHAATCEERYLDRACDIARQICVELASRTDGLIWEHYRSDWTIDWRYNIDDPKNLFRPYGYLPGHFVEWSKLLMLLHGFRPEAWMIDRARQLFAVAVDRAWDEANGGIHYAFGPDGAILDTDRYYWVHAEAIAAAALLGVGTGLPEYWRWYDRIWDYSDRFLIDHRYGGWFRVLDLHGRKYSDLKSPPAKTDYHPLSACDVALEAVGAGDGDDTVKAAG